jgi:cation diffusion facilitator family transporter
MNKWLIEHLVTGRSGGDEGRRRLLSGRLSGAVGISLNTLLGLGKVLIGIVTGSVAVMADAVNNLSDAAASIFTLIGFSLAARKSDDEHPFGHARYEYMTGVVVSAMVIVVGIQLIRAAYEKIIDPTPLVADTLIMILLVVMVLIKLWLYRFNINLGKLIDSTSLKATGIDSLNDAISTVAALIAILLFRFAGINIDGFIGIAVGLFIIYSGLTMVKETAGPLLGQSPDPKTVKGIADLVLSHEGVLGIHDLIVHDYGPGHIFASVHIEVDSREDIFVSHELVDDIEKEALEQLHIMLVGHMDPLDTQNPQVVLLSGALNEALSKIEGMRGIHDLRIVDGPKSVNVIFDAVASHEKPESTFREVERVAQETLTSIDPKYIAVINRDLDFAAHR